MLQVLNLMESKNHYLEKFYSLNEEALHRFRASEFDDLDDFYQRREKLLEIIRYIDVRMDQEQALVKTPASETHQKSLRELLAIKEQFVKRILDQDLEVLMYLDQEKSRLIQDLRGVEKGKQIGKFKNPASAKRDLKEA